MTSLKFLYEMFLPEARFPDEKFWTKDGDPIHAGPKGPPKGTTGKTHADIGARDSDDLSGYPGVPQELYPNINDVRSEHPDAYRELQTVLQDLGVSEEQLPEEAFLFDEHGNLTVTVPHTASNDGMTHELWWNGKGKSWEYVT